MPDHTAQLTVNLAALQGQGLRRLQRSVDMLMFARAAASVLTADAFDGYREFWNLAPSSNTRLSFDSAREESLHWHVTHCLRDAIDVVGAFLEEARMTCALFRLFARGEGTLGQLIQVEQEGPKFHKRSLPGKIQELKDDFNVSSDFDDHIITLNRARNCLVHRLGVVTPLDVDENDVLHVRWMDVGLVAESPDGTTMAVDEPQVLEAGWSLALRMGPIEKSFAIGDRVVLTYRELLGAIFSHQSYINNMTVSVQRYAEELGVVFPNAAEAGD